MPDKTPKFAYTRQYHVFLNPEQTALYHRAIAAQNSLFQYALKYLYRTFGVKHLGRPMPFGQTPIQGLLNQIKNSFIRDKYGLKRWNVKKIGLSSQAANEFLKTVYTNFTEYRKRLVKNSKMSKEEKYNYKQNITKDKHGRHKNPGHRSWYRIGSLNYLRKGASFRTVTTPRYSRQAGGVQFLGYTADGRSLLKVADFDTVEVTEDLKSLDSEHTALTKIKRLADGTFRLQITFTEPRTVQDKEKPAVTGFDWNMANNEAFRSSDGRRYFLDKETVGRAERLEDEINLLKSRRDTERNQHGKSKKWQKLDKKQRRLSAKRADLLTNEYRHLARRVTEKCDTVIVEKLDAYEMRKKGRSSMQDRGVNRRLALLKPYEVMSTVEQLVKKTGRKMIKVDSYYTSKACYGCGCVNHDLKVGEKEWICPNCHKKIDRDLNAAQNIKEWGLHPEKHAKYLEREAEIAETKKEGRKVPKKISPYFLVTEC